MTSEFERPLLTVDTVILTLIDARLHVLLVRRNKAPQKGVWTLPGGFVHTDEDKTAPDGAAAATPTPTPTATPASY